MSAGCDEFIAKPVRLDEVTEVIARLLRLEWTRGPIRTRPANDGHRERLPVSLAADLYELALQGDVHALTQSLAEARRNGAVPADLLSELTALAGSYDMKALREYLRPHTEAMQ